MWQILKDIWSTLTHPIQSAVRKRVDELATTEAVRRAVLRELVRLHFELYVVQGKLDRDRAMGLRQVVVDDLMKRIDLSKIDPESEETRKLVTRQVALKAIDLGTWIQIAEIASKGEFDPKSSIILVFRDQKGTTHTSNAYVPSLQSNFLFHKPIAFSGMDKAKIDAEVADMANERLKDERIEIVRSEVTTSPVRIEDMGDFLTQ